MDKVIIEGLRVDAVIGVFDWERQILQPVLVDLEMGCSIQAAAYSDDLADAVNYKAVCDCISEIIVSTQAKLLEHLAEKICFSVLQNYPAVHYTKLTLRKPTAITNAVAVGVSIERTRDDLRTRTGL